MPETQAEKTAAWRARVKAQGGTDKELRERGRDWKTVAPPNGLDYTNRVDIETMPQEPVRSTLHRMADVLQGRQPRPPSIGEAFDGATLVLPDASPLWPVNPVPSGEAPRRPVERTRRGRPPGAEDLTPLFATGLVLLTTFVVGEWAAPTADEANAIAVPLSNILARRIDLAAKLGRDASDTIALVVALMAYAYRVIPLTTERVREGLERRQEERVSRAGRGAAEFADGSGTHGMAAGKGNGEGAGGGSPYDPFDALAKARATGLSVLDRGAGVVPVGSATMDDR